MSTPFGERKERAQYRVALIAARRTSLRPIRRFSTYDNVSHSSTTSKFASRRLLSCDELGLVLKRRFLPQRDTEYNFRFGDGVRREPPRRDSGLMTPTWAVPSGSLLF